MKYSAKFHDYFNNTDHAGRIDAKQVVVLKHESINPFDQFCFYILIQDAVIEQVSFEASSTPALIAAGEYVSRWLENKPVKEAIGLQKQQILQELGLNNHFIHIADLLQRLVLKLDIKGCDGDSKKTGNVV